MNGKWLYVVPNLSNNRVNMLMNFSLQYPEIKKRIENQDFVKVSTEKIKGMPKGKGMTSDVTSAEVSRRAAFYRHIKIVEDCLREASLENPIIEKALKLMVTGGYSSLSASMKTDSIYGERSLCYYRTYYLTILDNKLESLLSY